MKKTLFSAFALICMLILNSSSRNSIVFVNNEITSSTGVENLTTNTSSPETAKNLLIEGNIQVIGGKYHMESGKVVFQ
jgi:carbonic anhydrase